jgi:hypothetical protein
MGLSRWLGIRWSVYPGSVFVWSFSQVTVVGGQRPRCQDIYGTTRDVHLVCSRWSRTDPQLHQLGRRPDKKTLGWPLPTHIVVNAASRTEQVAIEKRRLYLSLGVVNAKISETEHAWGTCFICLKAQLMKRLICVCHVNGDEPFNSSWDCLRLCCALWWSAAGHVSNETDLNPEQTIDYVTIAYNEIVRGDFTGDEPIFQGVSSTIFWRNYVNTPETGVTGSPGVSPIILMDNKPQTENTMKQPLYF